MNLPNKITMMRILFIPVFLVLLEINIPFKEWIAAGVFVLLSFTDTLDGYIARKTNQVTKFGKFADPLADKFLISAALIYFVGSGVPKWIAVVIIMREFAVTGLRLFDKGDKIAAASILGKLKTITQMIAVFAVILNIQPVAFYLLVLAVIFSLWSGMDYFIQLRHLFKNEV